MRKAILVSRHPLLPAQQKALEELKIQVIKTVQHISSVEDLIKDVKESGADSVVIAALPFQMLIQLVQLAEKEGIIVFQIKMKPVGLTKTKAEMRKMIDEKPLWRVAIPSADGETWRIMEFDGIFLLKSIVIDEVKVWP